MEETVLQNSRTIISCCTISGSVNHTRFKPAWKTKGTTLYPPSPRL